MEVALFMIYLCRKRTRKEYIEVTQSTDQCPPFYVQSSGTINNLSLYTQKKVLPYK